MPVTLTLKRRGAYTNLDYVEGDVKLDISSSESIDNITVKVEGISKTTVYAKKPGNERSKPKPIVEVHKLLYLSQVVWPDQKLRDTKASNTSSSSHFTLQAGSYTFPFRLRIPVNNACQPPPGALSMQNFHFTNNSLTTVSHPTSHVKQTLPPSLGGIEDAYIRYFVKVTVNRPSFFSRNLRHITPFVFCPIEPPRPPQSNQLFVRKKHTLAIPPKATEPSFFGSLFRKPPSLTGNGGTVAFEARLPNPAIIVPTESIPLTLILRRDAGSQGIVYIRSIQIMLGTTTFIAAQGFRRELGYLLPIVNVGNLNLTLPAGQNETIINPADFLQQSQASKGLALPDTVPPSFRTCNIARKYTLVLQMGVAAHSSSPPEMIQLTMDVQVFSGFKPPPELLGTATAPRPPPPPSDEKQAPEYKSEAETQAQMGMTELPTYDEAVADTLNSPGPVEPERRGHFDVEAQHLQGAETWDSDEKR